MPVFHITRREVFSAYVQAESEEQAEALLESDEFQDALDGYRIDCEEVVTEAENATEWDLDAADFNDDETEEG